MRSVSRPDSRPVDSTGSHGSLPREEAILETRADLNAAALARTRELMVKAVDPNDRHVVAAAIRAGAQVIVTTNLKDFPEEALKPFDLVAQHPDAFVSHVIDLAAGAVCKVVVEQAGALKNPPMTTEALLDELEKQGLTQSVTELRDLLLG